MNTLISEIAPLFADCSFPLYIYLPESKEFYQLLSDQPEEKPIPANMKAHLEDDSMHYQSFKKGDSFMYFYFIRLNLNGARFVVMINSDRERKQLNQVSASAFASLKELESALREDMDEKENSVQILRKSRQKMLKLLDGLVMPLFSISPEFEIINVNKELAELLGESHIPNLLGGKCYETIHGRSEPCEFCRMQEILDGEQTAGQTISLEFSGKQYYFEHHMFPIFSATGEMDEIGEFMIDVTENYKNLAHIEQYKERVKSFQKAEVDKMNEMGELKRAYRDLEKSYDEMYSKNRKMSRAIERLMADNNVTELVKLRQESREVKNKLIRSATALKNFQQTLEIQQEKYTELSKKTVYQMERLINTVNKKSTLNDNDLKVVLKTVTEEVKELRKQLNITTPEGT